jgi:hypothetical protein
MEGSPSGPVSRLNPVILSGAVTGTVKVCGNAVATEGCCFLGVLLGEATDFSGLVQLFVASFRKNTHNRVLQFYLQNCK